jgi:predicted enzyme related to lactoylglutathione lyase
MTMARIYRIIMPVCDLDRAAHFYLLLLGDEGMRVSAGRHYFACGGVILAVYSPQDDGDAAESRPNVEHVCFAVPDLDDVFQRAQRVGGLSTKTGDGSLPMGAIARRPWGERSFCMTDPSGNPLCLVYEKTVFTPGSM